MRVAGFNITRDRGFSLREADIKNADATYEKALRDGKKLILATLASRSGGKWLGDIFNAHDNATGRVEPVYEAAAWYRWVTYNKLPIDTSGVISLFKYFILEDWRRGDIAYVVSPHFSHGIAELIKELAPHHLYILLNDPEFTVQSMYNKGMFREYRVRKHPELVSGWEPMLTHSIDFNFGRLVPRGDYYKVWEQLTQVGRCSWFGNLIYSDIFKQCESLSAEKVKIFHLKKADQNYNWYKNLAQRYNLTPVLDERSFLKLKWIQNKVSENTKHEWTALEQAEFEQETKAWRSLYDSVCLSASSRYEVL